MRAPRLPSALPIPEHPPRGRLSPGLAVMAMLAIPIDRADLARHVETGPHESGPALCCAGPVPVNTLESWLSQAQEPGAKPPTPVAGEAGAGAGGGTGAQPAPPAEGGPAARRRAEWRLAPFVAAGAIGGVAGTPLPLFIQVAAPLPQPDATKEPETYVLIDGVPPGATLSKGKAQGEGTWRIPIEALTDLTLTVPPDFAGTTTLTVTAVTDHGGDVVARQSKELAVPIFAPLPDPVPLPSVADEEPPEPADEAAVAAVPPKPPAAAAAAAVTPEPQAAPEPAKAQPAEPPPAQALPVEAPPVEAPPVKAEETVAVASPLPIPAPPPPAPLPRPPVVNAAVPRAAAPPPPAPPEPAKPAAVPSAPRPPSSVPESTLMKRGDELFAQGDLAGARLFYEMAAAGGSDPAALALGKTHDPVIHERLRVRGLPPDPDKAAEWYGRAAANGNAEAEARLKELAAWLTNRSRPR